MSEREPETIKLAPGERLMIEVPDSSPRSTEIREELRNLVRESAEKARNALSNVESRTGSFQERDLFEAAYDKRYQELSKKLHEIPVSGDEIVMEVLDVLTGDSKSNISPALARDIASFIADHLGFAPSGSQ